MSASTSGPSGADYLDAIFAAIRALSQEIAAMKGWITNAERASKSSWRFQFFAAARASQERARAHLTDVEERLRELGPADDVPPPLDKLPKNVAAMKAELGELERRLSRVEAEAVGRPIGNG
jgi:hypothetical protein